MSAQFFKQFSRFTFLIRGQLRRNVTATFEWLERQSSQQLLVTSELALGIDLPNCPSYTPSISSLSSFALTLHRNSALVHPRAPWAFAVAILDASIRLQAGLSGTCGVPRLGTNAANSMQQWSQKKKSLADLTSLLKKTHNQSSTWLQKYQHRRD